MSPYEVSAYIFCKAHLWTNNTLLLYLHPLLDLSHKFTESLIQAMTIVLQLKSYI